MEIYSLLQPFLSDYRQELYGRQLAKLLPESQKTIADTLKTSEKKTILKSRKTGPITFYSLNASNTEIKHHLLMAETKRTIGFLNKHRTLAHTLPRDDRTIGVFGSYAKSKQNSRSDVDIFIIGRKRSKDPKRTDVDIKYFSENEFKELLGKRNPLVLEIARHHVLLSGAESFIGMVWRSQHGDDTVVQGERT